MSWLDRLMSGKGVSSCPLCPLPSNPSVDGASKGDKRLVPSLSPTCPPTDPGLDALCNFLPLADAVALREERAGILEYEAGFTRAEAEARAGITPRPP